MVRKIKDLKYYEAVGRRKEAVAVVRLYIVGKDKDVTVQGNKIKAGELFFNKKPIEVAFPLAYQKAQYLLPLKLTNNLDRFAISIISSGGGINGQLDAIILGLSRAIQIIDRETFRPVLKKQGLLTRDPRARERRKVGTGGKARRQKQSPKR